MTISGTQARPTTTAEVLAKIEAVLAAAAQRPKFQEEP